MTIVEALYTDIQKYCGDCDRSIIDHELATATEPPISEHGDWRYELPNTLRSAWRFLPIEMKLLVYIRTLKAYYHRVFKGSFRSGLDQTPDRLPSYEILDFDALMKLPPPQIPIKTVDAPADAGLE